MFLIDGLFLQAAPVRHREILDLLERGVAVAGSSQHGRAARRRAVALRHARRRRGLRLYRDGVVDGDDEVARRARPRRGGYRALSEPLVNIRIALRDAVAAGVITDAEARAAADHRPGLPSGRASTGPWSARAARGGGRRHRFLTWHRRDPCDAKARRRPADAAHGAATITAAPGRAGTSRSTPGYPLLDRLAVAAPARRSAGTGSATTDRHRDAMLLHPGYAALHRREILAGWPGRPVDPTVEHVPARPPAGEG